MSQPPLRLTELVATLSIAADLGTGHPLERALRACLLALEIGEALGCDEAALADCYYVALLRYAGCAADARHRAALFGDEIALGPEIDMVELWQLGPMLAFLHRHGFDRLPPAEFETLMATGVQRSVEAAVGTCEIGQSLSARLGLGPSIARALGDVFERWDGRGVPGQGHGAQIALAARIVTVALDVELFYRVGGIDAVQTLLRERSGGQYDPAIVTLLQARADLCAVLELASPSEAVLEREPGPRPLIAEAALDEALRAVADFVDLRLPMMSGHSTAVATLCVQAGARLGLGDAELSALRRAAYVHDLGMASVSVSVWEKAGPLNAASAQARSLSSGASTPMCHCWGSSACCRRSSRRRRERSTRSSITTSVCLPSAGTEEQRNSARTPSLGCSFVPLFLCSKLPNAKYRCNTRRAPYARPVHRRPE